MLFLFDSIFMKDEYALLQRGKNIRKLMGGFNFLGELFPVSEKKYHDILTLLSAIFNHDNFQSNLLTTKNFFYEALGLFYRLPKNII